MNATTSRIPRLLAGVVMMLFAGIIYAWSILKAPLAAEFGFSSAALGLNFTITMACFCVGGILGGVLTKRISQRIAVLIAGVLAFAGFFITSRMQGNIAVLYLAYGVLSGLGIGIAYNVVISCVSGWFPDRRATASGAMMMGFGASSLVLGSVTGYLINAIGWRSAYLVLGVAILVVLAAGSLLMKPNTQPPKAAKRADGGDAKEYSTQEMVRRASFWKFYLYSLLICAIGTCVISFAKDLSLSVGAAESMAVLMVGVLSVCNGLGRILTGSLFDVLGRRKTTIMASGVAIVSPVIVLIALTAGSLPLMVVGLVVVGLCYGTMPPISSGFVNSAYGAKHFALNFSIANTMLVPASFSATIGGAILSSTGSYVPVFLMLLGCAVAGAVINLTNRNI